MSDEIQEELEKIYNLRIEVIYRSVKCYDIIFIVNGNTIILPLLYDKTRTLESNVSKLISKIDKEILKIFKKGD